jgi:hypothetical protein
MSWRRWLGECWQRLGEEESASYFNCYYYVLYLCTFFSEVHEPVGPRYAVPFWSFHSLLLIADGVVPRLLLLLLPTPIPAVSPGAQQRQPPGPAAHPPPFPPLQKAACASTPGAAHCWRCTGQNGRERPGFWRRAPPESPLCLSSSPRTWKGRIAVPLKGKGKGQRVLTLHSTPPDLLPAACHTSLPPMTPPSCCPSCCARCAKALCTLRRLPRRGLCLCA